MARTMKKFSAGGAQGRYERRMADIEKDFKKAMARKTGKAAEVAEAKRQQRIADAKDDLAKRTGADRTATRAAEKLAESNLTKTRKYGAPKAVTTEAPAAKVTDSLGAITAPKSDLSTPAKKVDKPKPKPAATTPKRMGDQGFAYKKKDMPTTGKDVSTHYRYVRGGSNSGAAADGTAAKRLENKGLKTDSKATGATSASLLAPKGSTSRSGSLFGGLFTTSDAYRKSQEAKYGKAKGGSVKKETTMDKKKKPAVLKRPMPKEPITGGANTVPLTPERKEFLKELAKRNAKPGMAKGGKAATKFGAAMKKKSADTKGRAMMKFAKGGSIDGCAVKGKTKTSMVKMKNGGSC